MQWSCRRSSGSTSRRASPAFVPVLAVLHLGTAAALLFLYRRDWARIIVGFFRAAVQGRIDDPDQRLAIMLIIGSVPAGIVGFLLQDPLKSLFANPRLAAAFLIVNGGILFDRRVVSPSGRATPRRRRCSSPRP